MSKSGNNPQNVTKTTTQAPPAYLQPYLKQGASDATNLYNKGMPQYYPGQTVANFTPAQLAAQGKTLGFTLGNNPALSAAGNFATNIMNNNPAGNNPWTEQLNNSIKDTVMPDIASQFEKSGRYGSPAMAGEEAKAMTDALAPTEYNAYMKGVGQQIGAMSEIPGLNNTELANLSAASGVGATQQQQQQNHLNSLIQKYKYNSNLPYQNLNWYNNLLGQQANTGGTTTQTQPYYQNTTAGMMGGALGGARLGAQYGGPWGAAAGGGLGLLFGAGVL